ncbi:MAG: RNA polymerase sigma factor [Bacteroidales bacterium]|jgi:RNA polymerase sigma-70 factor (ECF subfamily)|nr:RNA polymerase sigma factor [Bacteroidales bacterium]MDD3702342.1 RNA polymerase sigma factor [Bacteroidales bacterium]MDY0370294.1 RNA polymerase sigma factor [Bacteroidales bacterium]
MNENDFRSNILPFSGKMLRRAVQLLKNEDDAQDVLQDVFLKLWQQKEVLWQIENIEAYLSQMVKNRCIDIIRSNRIISLDFAKEKELTGRSANDLNNETELRESADQIKKLIGKLPELQQRVMYLRDIEQLEYEEISKNTGLTVNAVRVNLSRARKKVRDEFLKINSDGNKKNNTITATLF